MANQEHLDLLKQGADVWNKWREEHPEVQPDFSWIRIRHANLANANLSYANLSDAHLDQVTLSNANLRGANLSYADLGGVYLYNANLYNAILRRTDLRFANLGSTDLSRANLRDAKLIHTYLGRADLRGANLGKAHLYGADLSGADLSEANLCRANLRRANLSNTNLRDTDLSYANLSYASLDFARLIETNLNSADLTLCSVYGISVWDVQIQDAKQDNLIIAYANQPTITISNLKVAQFIYLLLNNREIRDVIDTITTKVVLILGRFTPKRKQVLDALRDELHKHDYLPVVFDFKKPRSRDFTETARTLAHLSRFIIADLTESSSIPLELQAIVPDLAVPVQPLFKVSQKSKHVFSMFQDLSKKYHWVLPIYHYTDQASLLQSLKENVIVPAEQKAKELAKR